METPKFCTKIDFNRHLKSPGLQMKWMAYDSFYFPHISEEFNTTSVVHLTSDKNN